jgi:phosphate acetyltransferase
VLAIANKVQLENIKLVTEGLRSSLPTETLVNAIPLVSSLNNPTIKEIVDELDAKVLFEQFLNNEIGNYSVGAMQLRNYLLHLKEKALVITW